MSEPQPREVYRHYKGGLYIVLGVSRSSEAWDDPDSRCVVYVSAEQSILQTISGQLPELIHRPLRMWSEHVDAEGYSGPRFKLEMGA